MSQKNSLDKSLLLPIEDTFKLKKRGVVIIGHIERGVLHIGQEVDIVGWKDSILKTTVTGIEMFHRGVMKAEMGSPVGVLLGDLAYDDIKQGMVIASPNSIKPHRKFKCEVYILHKDEKGRSRPFFSGYTPGFFIYNIRLSGRFTLPDNIASVMPGDTAHLNVELIMPMALEIGTSFWIAEGAVKVGQGRVIELLD
ncbi:MAG TPA: EF-Tu/IF-2/RF-3 family GTPase [Aggregatilineales bacterium]|nr:EF-Tu/IF-2/RF-3 family GTPase [Aggregatilineales bacterium]